METPYNNVTSRRKKRNKRLYKEQSELPYGENKCVEAVGISQESINGIKMVEKHNSVNENEICSLIQTCDMQEKECKIGKKKRKLYDIHTSLFLQTSEEGCCENDSVKEFYVNNIQCYPKKKHKKVDSSDLEAVCSTETHSPFTHKLFELNSDSDIDTQNKHNFMKVNKRKGCNESNLNDNKMTVSTPHGSSKHTRGFEHSMKPINKFSNENENLCEGHGKVSTGIEGKNKKLTQSKERLDRTETQKCLNKSENVIEFDSVACSKLVEQIKKEEKHKDKSEENLLIQKIEFDSASCTDLPIKKRKKKNKHILEEIKPIPDSKEFDSFSCTDQVYKKNMKKTKHKNKLKKNKILQDTEQSSSESCTYLPSNKIKEKKNHKYKLEVNNVLPRDNEGVHSLSSTDFSSKQIKKKKPTPHGCSKHTRGFEHSMKPINKFSNENENLCEGHGKESTGIEGKNKKLTQSKDRLDRTETQKCLNKSENVIEFDSVACSKLVEHIKKEQKHKDKSEENLLTQKIEFDSASCTDLPIKKKKKKNKHILEEIKPIPDSKEFDSFSCTDQVYKKNMKKTKHKNKLQKNKILQDTEQSNSESCTYLPSNKIKEKKNHKYKLEVNNVLPHDNEGAHSLSSTDVSSKQKKKKPKNELDEIKLRLLAQALEKFKPKFVEFTDNPSHVNKKAKDKCSSLHNEVEHSMPNIDSFATRESDYIVSSKEIIVPNSVDGGDSCLHFQPSENNYLRKNSAEYVGLNESEKMQDKKESNNKKVYSISKNEIYGANEWKTTSSNQKVFLNNVSKERKLLYNTNKNHKNDNESLRAALISSALKSIGYKKTEVNNFHVDCKERSINIAAQTAVAETNEHTCNQTYTRKHKEKVKHKDKDSNKSIHDGNKKSFNTQNGNDNLRKALISAALKRMKTSEWKHTKKKSTPEYEVKPKHKSKRKSSIESSVERNSKIVNEIENMRSSLIAAALTKMSATNDVNKTSDINNKNGQDTG